MAKVILFNRKVVTYTSVDGEVRPLIYEASIPPQTIRFRFEETDYNPSEIENGGTWTKVADSSYNDWDWYCADTNWDFKFSNEETYEGLLTTEHKVSIIATGDLQNIRSNDPSVIELGDVPSCCFLFASCTGLTSIGDNTFNDLNIVPYMFYSCTGLTSIGNNSFINVTYADVMFINCTGLTNIPDNSFNNVTNAYMMFTYCSGLTSIPENSFNNVTNATSMFAACTGLTSIPDNMFNNVTETNLMFHSCTRVEHGALALYNKWIAGGKVISHSNTFKDCGKDTTTGLAELQQIPQSWGGLADDTTDKLIIGGKEYRTVTIGNQTWIAQNLDLETDSGSVVSERRSENEDYGRMYQWDNAVEVADSIDGWHLPSRAEWNTLRDFAGGVNVAGTKLKTKSGWSNGDWSSGNGTDDYGFGVLPCGICISNSYYDVGSGAYFWTSDEGSSSNVYFKHFGTDSSMGEGNDGKTGYLSVRLIKDN